MELSLCMIVKNEEENLARCLGSVQEAVDEIVIADTGSTDATKDIARAFGAKVIDIPWEDDFSAARNASLRAATKPFLLWLDADDMLEEAEKQKLIRLKERLDDSVDALMLPYYYAFGEDGKPSLIFERERIVRRAAGFVFCGVVHEAMAVSGNVLHEDIVVRHARMHRENSRRNLKIYEKWLARGRRMTPRDQYYYARELMDCGETERAQQAFSVFLSMDGGWTPNRADAFLQRGRCLSALGREEEAREMFFSALQCGTPRAEALCALGESCMRKQSWDQAVFWFRAAMLAQPKSENGNFVQTACYDYIPAMQLCVCYDKMGRYREAARMNEQALLFRPDDAVAMQNRAYFEKVFKNRA